MSVFARALEPVLAFILTATLFGSCIAHAQVVQPTYIRPSKGSNIQVYSGTINTIPLAGVISSTFDFTAFSAIQLTVTSENDVMLNCKQFPEIQTQGSLTKSDINNFSTINTLNGDFISYIPWNVISPTKSFVAYSVNAVAPYVRFKVLAITNLANPAPPTDCNFTITMTPLPLQTGMPVVPVTLQHRAASAIDIAAYPAVTAVYSNTDRSIIESARLQNVGTFPIICASPGNPVLFPSYNYQYALAAGVANDDGKGGSITINDDVQSTRCSAVGGASRLARYIFIRQVQ